MELLFVYGTLRPGLASGVAASLVRELDYLGAATVEAVLYDLGEYPGMVVGSGVVHGDLLRIASPAQLAAFDAFEECGGPNPLFVRVMMTAQPVQGGSIRVWAYTYARPIAAGSLIDGGDYVAYRNCGP